MKKELKENLEEVKRSWKLMIVLALLFATTMTFMSPGIASAIGVSIERSLVMIWISFFTLVMGLWLAIAIAILGGSWLIH
ncbi:MAG: hypothetical protein ACTSPI_01360 [Candidatus Heimdallarchaeaceae archaeon]